MITLPVYYHNRGTAKYNQKDYAGAIVDYDEAIRLQPGDSIDYYQRGTAKYNQKDYAGAILDYDEAIRLKPGNWGYHYFRADTYEALGEHQKAQNDRHQVKIIQRRNDPQTQLYEAIQRGQKAAALECLANIRRQHPDTFPTALTPHGEEPALFTLARFGHSSWLADFLQKTRPDITDAENNWALHVAASHGHFDFFNALLTEKIIEGRSSGGYHWPSNRRGETPIHAAAIAGKADFLIRFKEAYNGEQDLQAVTVEEDTIVHLMARHGHVKPLETLLRTFPFLSVRMQNKAGQDALMTAVIQKNPAMVELLLKHHIDFANRDTEGRTALHLAVLSGDLAIVKMLVAKGAPLDVRDHAGKSPLDYVTLDSDIGRCLSKQKREAKHQLQHFDQRMRKWRNLVIQGGSVKGLAYPAALRELEEQGALRLADIERVGGTSAGAITALLIGLGYSLDEIEHLTGVKTIPGSPLPQVKFKELLDGPFGEKILQQKDKDWGPDKARAAALFEKLKTIDGFLTALQNWRALRDLMQMAGDAKKEFGDQFQQLTKDFGLCPGKKLYDLFDQLIRAKLKEKTNYDITTPVTFKELHDAGFKGLYFTGVNTRTGEVEYFSHEHTPDMLVANAVRISMSIPGVFYPVPKVTKDENGREVSGKDLYVDGGVSANFPIDLFDFARYGHDKHLPPDQAQVNLETLGLRLVSPQLKARYEGSIPPGELEPKDIAPATFFGHILDVLNAIYKTQESQFNLSGALTRTALINTLNIGTLDFDRVEEEITRKALGVQGREGVKDFLKRVKQNMAYTITLPDPLKKALKQYTHIIEHQVEHGQNRFITEFDPNCPGLIVEFYGYEDIRLHEYLHEGLYVSLWARDKDGMTAFHLAAMQGNVTALKRLLQRDPSGASAKNAAGQMPHELTEAQKHPQIMALLAEYEKNAKKLDAPADAKQRMPESLHAPADTKQRMPERLLASAVQSNQPAISDKPKIRGTDTLLRDGKQLVIPTKSEVNLLIKKAYAHLAMIGIKDFEAYATYKPQIDEYEGLQGSLTGQQWRDLRQVVEKMEVLSMQAGSVARRPPALVAASSRFLGRVVSQTAGANTSISPPETSLTKVMALLEKVGSQQCKDYNSYKQQLKTYQERARPLIEEELDMIDKIERELQSILQARLQSGHPSTTAMLH